ncbi:MAG: metal-sulfur cluster assembly factor, partial [Actinomyces sp.]|nr:metal-sulfur cluster assembly factor [Actinomyces sp.]
MSNPMAQSGPVEQRFVPVPPPPVSGMPDLDERGTVAGADVAEALKDVIDPELGINIVDLGLGYGISIDPEDNVQLDMTLTSAACPLTDVIERQTDMVLQGLATSVTVNWVWMPAWGPDRITPDGREQLRAIGF